MGDRSGFTQFFLGNLRLSAIVCAVVAVCLAIYALIVSEPMMWNIVAFLALGMLVSSVLNAWMDSRRGNRSA